MFFVSLIVFMLISITSSQKSSLKRNYESTDFIISSFGEKHEYECSGSCYCDEEKRKTSSNIVVSKRFVSYLFFSLSSVVALNRARTYFESKCQEEMFEECYQSSSIKSSVEKCTRVVNKEKEGNDKEFFEKRKFDERRVYFCYGNCEPNFKIRKESSLRQSKHLNCKKLKKEGEVIVYESDLNVRASTPSNNFRSTAKSKFQEYFLVDFCRDNSKIEYIYEQSLERFSKKRGEKYVYKQSKTVKSYGCVSYKSRGYESGNVRCRQVDPKSNSFNWKWRLDVFNREKGKWDLI